MRGQAGRSGGIGDGGYGGDRVSRGGRQLIQGINLTRSYVYLGTELSDRVSPATGWNPTTHLFICFGTTEADLRDKDIYIPAGLIPLNFGGLVLVGHIYPANQG